MTNYEEAEQQWKLSRMNNYTYFSHCYLGRFRDGGNIGEIDHTILKVSYDTLNSIFAIQKNDLEDFKDWIARVMLDETKEYDRFLDGSLDVDELFDEVGLTIHKII